MSTRAYSTHRWACILHVWGADLLRVLVVQPGAVRCPVSSIAAGRHYIGFVKGEALYWQSETYVLGSPFHITASQR